MTSTFQKQALLKAAKAVQKVFTPKQAQVPAQKKQEPANEDWMSYAA